MSVFEPRTKNSTKGEWKLNGNKVVWVEEQFTSTFDQILGIWVKKRTGVVEKTPEESPLKLMKEFRLKILFKDIRPNPKKFRSKEIAWFMEIKLIKIREDQEFMYLCWSDGRLYIKDLYNQMTVECPFRSGPDIIVTDETEEPEFISKKDLEAFIKTSDPKMVFDGKDDNGDFQIGSEIKPVGR